MIIFVLAEGDAVVRLRFDDFNPFLGLYGRVQAIAGRKWLAVKIIRTVGPRLFWISIL